MNVNEMLIKTRERLEITQCELAEMLIKTRKRLGITQCELAELLSYDPSLISRMEKGERNITDYCLIRIIEDVLEYPKYYITNRNAKKRDYQREEEILTKVEKIKKKNSCTKYYNYEEVLKDKTKISIDEIINITGDILENINY